MSANQEKMRRQDLLVPEAQGDPNVASMRERMPWFVGVDVGAVDGRYYGIDEITTELRTSILEGKHQQNSVVVLHTKLQDGTWKQTNSTLIEFAKNHFKLRVLFQPVWSHALAGLKWGALAGAALKLLDSLFLLGSADPKLALLFLVAMGVCCIPRIGVFGVAAFSFFMMKYSRINFFMMGLAAAVVGAILGCLPGMAIGGLIGFCRKHSLERAQNVVPEPGGLLLNAVFLPFGGGCALLALYLFVFNPWLAGVLG